MEKKPAVQKKSGKQEKQRRQEESRQKAIKPYEKVFQSLRAQYKQETYVDRIDMQKYGNTVVKLRNEQGWSQKELGKKIGVTYVSVSNLERGKLKQADWDTVLLLCAIFDVTPDFLFGLSEVRHGIMIEDGKPHRRVAISGDGFFGKIDNIRPKEAVAYWLSEFIDDRRYSLTNAFYHRHPELCLGLVLVLSYDNPDINERLAETLKGLCAMYFSREEWEEIKEGYEKISSGEESLDPELLLAQEGRNDI